MPQQKKYSYWVMLYLWGFFLFPPQAQPFDLTDLSLEDLMAIEVTLVSRKQGKWFETPAAVSVLTRDDLHRAGATSIPEALRLVPGVQVARIDANKWAVSARGINGRFAQQLLVLIDGRTIYTPLFSGVFWEMHDVMLEDVNRIEIIRGPGGTLWGANAINGIINIVTENASETQGSHIKVGTGTEERGFVSARYGRQINPNTSIRTYGKFFARDAFVDATGQHVPDNWHMSQLGVRLDQSQVKKGNLTFQGDIFAGTRGQIYRFPTLITPFVEEIDNDTRLNGGNLLGRFTRLVGDTGEMSLQIYYDHTTWRDTLIAETRNTYDLDFQHRFKWGTQQEITYGLGYRLSQDHLQNGPWTTVNQSKRSLILSSAFLQNTLALMPNLVSLTLGSKFEHNTYTGFEYQPGARLLITPHPKHTVWAALTRAVRIPSRSENDLGSAWTTLPPGELFQGSPPVLINIAGDRALKSSILHALEFGYRLHPANDLLIDVAIFFNRYKGLRSARLGTPFLVTNPSPLHLVLPAYAANTLGGITRGFEWSADWQPASLLRMRTGYTFLKMDLKSDLLQIADPDALPPGSEDLLSGDNRNNPKHQIFAWTAVTPTPQWHLDGMLRYVDQLPASKTKRYLELDLSLGWHFHPQFEMTLTGQNLLHAHHREFEATLVGTKPTEIQRSVYTALTWRLTP